MQRLGDILDADIKAIFESYRDFTESMTIGTSSENARPVVGSLQSDLVTFNSAMSEMLNAFAVKLYIPEQPDLRLETGVILYVNGLAFRVVASALTMGVRELSLERR